MKWKRRGMVFMMNDFKAYLRYYVNSNKRLLILVFIILFLIMPFLPPFSRNARAQIFMKHQHHYNAL